MFNTPEFTEKFENGKRKFLVAEISDQNGCKKIVVRTGYSWHQHRVIHDKIQEEFRQFDCVIEILGGGMIRVGEEIAIYDYSMDYGQEPDRNLTLEIVKRAYPDRAIKARE